MTDSEHTTSFRNIVGDIDLRKDGVYELASIDDFKEKMLAIFFEQMMHIEDLDVTDEETYDKVCHVLSIIMNEVFAASDHLRLGDEVVSCDETLYMLIDGSNTQPSVHRLPQNFKLRGDVMGFIVKDMPDTSLIDDVTKYNDKTPVPMVRFGLGLMLYGATVDADGKRINYDDYGLGVCVPLDHQPLPMKKVIK